LLKAFGSVTRLRKATEEQIAAVPGISKTLARQILDFLASR
jgi:excinuclease ABC subunit C